MNDVVSERLRILLAKRSRTRRFNLATREPPPKDIVLAARVTRRSWLCRHGRFGRSRWVRGRWTAPTIKRRRLMSPGCAQDGLAQLAKGTPSGDCLEFLHRCRARCGLSPLAAAAAATPRG